MTENVELTIRKLFNKLTPETFEHVLKDFTNIELDGKDHLVRLVVDLIMNKVVTNSTLMKAGLFAKLISRDEKSFKLKKEILARCQTEFQLGVENADKIKISEDKLRLFQYSGDHFDDLRSELDRFKSKSIKCSVANIRLIGEFFNHDVAGTGAIMECGDALLSRNDDVSVTILCALINTIGPKLIVTVELFKKYEETPIKLNLPKLKENDKFVNWVEQVFEHLKLFIRNYGGNMSLSLETAVQEILKLQEKEWKTEEIINTPMMNTPIPVTKAVNSTITVGWNFLPILKQRKIDPQVDKLLKQLTVNNVPQIAHKFSRLTMEWYIARIPSIIYKMFEMSADTISTKLNWKSCAYLVQIFCSKSYRASNVFRRILTTLCQTEIEHNKSHAIWLKNREDKLTQKSSKSHQASRQLEYEISMGRKRFRGNVQFIGELFNLGILTFEFVKTAVDELIDSRDDGNLESLCMLLKTTGELMHKENGKLMTEMFKSLEILANSGEVSVAMKTVIMGVVNLSAKSWESNSSISKSSSLMSVSSNSNSEALRQRDVTKEIGTLAVATSSGSVLKPDPVPERYAVFELIKSQLEKSVDTMPSSNGEFNMTRGGMDGNPGTSRSINSIENNTEVRASSCPPPQLKYLSMYTNYDRMLKQMPPEVVEDINMEISTIIYQRWKHQKGLESLSTSQNDFENDMFTMI